MCFGPEWMNAGFLFYFNIMGWVLRGPHGRVFGAFRTGGWADGGAVSGDGIGLFRRLAKHLQGGEIRAYPALCSFLPNLGT